MKKPSLISCPACHVRIEQARSTCPNCGELQPATASEANAKVSQPATAGSTTKANRYLILLVMTFVTGGCVALLGYLGMKRLQHTREADCIRFAWRLHSLAEESEELVAEQEGIINFLKTQNLIAGDQWNSKIADKLSVLIRREQSYTFDQMRSGIWGDLALIGDGRCQGLAEMGEYHMDLRTTARMFVEDERTIAKDVTELSAGLPNLSGINSYSYFRYDYSAPGMAKLDSKKSLCCTSDLPILAMQTYVKAQLILKTINEYKQDNNR